MAYWFCSVFTVVCVVKRKSSPRCRSELIDSAWVVIVPGQKCIKKKKSNAIHLLQPTVQKFQHEHQAYKFQIAITIVCHKAVDPSVVTQPPVTLTSEMIAVYADTVPPLDSVNRQLLNFIEVFRLNGSGWVFSHFESLQLTP